MHASERELHANLPKLEGKINMKNEVRGNPNISCGYTVLNQIFQFMTSQSSQPKIKKNGFKDWMYNLTLTLLVQHLFIRHP